MRVIVVGAGGTTRELLRRLSEVWDPTVVDTDPERLAEAEKVRRIVPVVGDGSSQVVLKRASLDEADALVAATNDDSVNLEVSRIGLEAGLLRVLAVAADPERLADYRELQVPAFSPDSLTARHIEVNLEPRRVSSTAFADGRAEAIEVRIAPDSPVRGKALKELRSESWLVAAILRGGRLIVPHGDTVLEMDDLVTVVGAAADFSLIVRTFTGGEARFPLDFGKRVAVAVDSVGHLEGPVAEAINLTRNSQASSLVLVHRRLENVRDEARAAEISELLDRASELAEAIEVRRRAVDGPPSRALISLPQDESVGLLVLPAPGSGEVLGRLSVVRLLRSIFDARRPVLVSRGSHPYDHILVPARDTRIGRAATRAAIDLAAYAKATLTGVAVVPPAFLTGADTKDEARRAVTHLHEEAAVQGVTVRRKLRQGNPARVITDLAVESRLVVLGVPARKPSFLRLGIVGHIVQRVSSSVLLVPSQE